MKEQTWLARLGDQLPGWVVWTSSASKEKHWRATPAPAGTSLAQVREMPRTVYADTPARLRTIARERYGWDDYCETCPGTLARECGHRQPEREGARRAS